MTTPIPMPTARSYGGFALETVYGTAVAPSMTVPIKTFSPTDAITMLDDTGIRGSMVQQYGSVPGPSWTTYDISGDAYPDSILWFLTSLLPDVTTTGASPPYTHVASILNSGNGQPKGRTFTDYQGLTATSGARRYPGCVVSDLDLNFNADGLLSYDAKMLALPSSAFPTAPPTKTLGTLVPTPAYIPTITVAGSQVLTVTEGKISLSRKVTPISTGDGSQAPVLFSGPIKMSASFTYIANDETELLRYLNNNQGAYDVNFGSTLNANTGIQLHSTKCIYKSAALDRGQDYTAYKVSAEMHGNTTDVGSSGGFGVVKATVLNALPTGTFA